MGEVKAKLADAGLIPRAAAVSRMSFDPVPAAAGLARRFVANTLSGCPPESREAAVLVTSELVTNAVLHGRTTVQLDVVTARDRVLVAVTDGTSDRLQRRPRDDAREGGRGLVVVESVADRVGTIDHDAGKTVWAMLRLPA